MALNDSYILHKAKSFNIMVSFEKEDSVHLERRHALDRSTPLLLCKKKKVKVLSGAWIDLLVYKEPGIFG